MKKATRWLALALTVALAVSAAVVPASAAAFRDVPAGHWARAEIVQAVDSGLVQGVSADTFGLGRAMTRAAFTVVLCRFFGWELQSPAAGSYADNQDPNAWYYSAVETACANGALTLQEKLFRPNDPITREEMAVMLVRALGYGPIAGLELGLECPFDDALTNRGYLTLAYHLGISRGTGERIFSPDTTATREQAVVMLMRVYQRWTTATAERIGVARFSDDLSDLKGCGVVALAGPRMTANGGLSALPEAENARLAREAVRAGGAKALLGVSGGQSTLRAKPAQQAAAIAAQAAEYDGVFLDAEKLPESRAGALTNLVRELKTALGDKLLIVAVEAPAVGKKAWGYEYGALSRTADRLVLRAAAADTERGGYPILAPEPLEEAYFALATVAGEAEMSRCSLWLTTTGFGRELPRGKTAPVYADGLESLLADPLTKTYWSDRYGSAYLERGLADTSTVVWYHDGAAMAERMRLAAFFGLDSLCLGDLRQARPAALAGLGK